MSDETEHGRAAGPGWESLFDLGLSIRREVLGREHVDRSMAGLEGFDADFQRLVTEYCWGAVWGRDGLDRRTRSMLNVAMLAALGRPQELGLHVTGALRNGCTFAQVQEVLMQVGVYCGIPAALDALRVARRVHADFLGRAGEDGAVRDTEQTR